MKPATIATLDDLRAIERDGRQRWMRFDRIIDALDDVALRHGGRPALTALATADDASPRRWNHRELLAEIRRSASLFRALADGREPRVALLLPPLPEAWFALWGAETAGIACVAKPGAALDEAELLAFATPRIPERAAVPKHIECLDALPLTAIGKVYKPALRLRATERVVRERLRQAGLDARVAVQGTDRNGGIVLRFVPSAGGDRGDGEGLHAALRELMAGFALAWELA